MDAKVHTFQNTIIEYSDRIEVILNYGHITIFDLDDLQYIQNEYWYTIHNCGDCLEADNQTCKLHQYACFNYDKRDIKAHNWVMEFTPHDGLTIDHINGNKLDNRKANLRIATKQTQAINAKIQRNNTTGVIGVSYYEASAKNNSSDYYVANWYEDGKRKKKCFNVKKYGIDGAFKLACKARENAEKSVPAYALALGHNKE